MKNNRITAIIFEENSLFLAPAYRKFSGYYEGDEIVFRGEDKENYSDDYRTEFNDKELGYARNRPDGDYHLYAKILPNKNEFKVSFSLFNNKTSQFEGHIIFDAKDYLVRYYESFNAASGASSLDEAERLESAFSIRYLEKSFSSIIKGNENFWQKFYRDLDMATSPLNMAISNSIDGTPMPIRVEP